MKKGKMKKGKMKCPNGHEWEVGVETIWDEHDSPVGVRYEKGKTKCPKCGEMFSSIAEDD